MASELLTKETRGGKKIVLYEGGLNLKVQHQITLTYIAQNLQ
jgi:hypothetical protein